MKPAPSPGNPELLIVSVNTNETDWWLGTTASTTTTTATPIMCHQAEIVFSWASRLMFSRLSAICAAAMIVKTRKMVPVSVFTTSGNQRFSKAVVNTADPYRIAAVTEICPTRLNHPVNQPHAGLPNLEAQK